MIPKKYFQKYLRDLRAKVSWAELLPKLGLAMIGSQSRRGPIGILKCPFCKKEFPPLQLFADGRFVCTGCGANGSIFGFTKRIRDLTINGTIKFFEEEFGIPKPVKLIKKSKRF